MKKRGWRGARGAVAGTLLAGFLGPAALRSLSDGIGRCLASDLNDIALLFTVPAPSASAAKEEETLPPEATEGGSQDDAPLGDPGLTSAPNGGAPGPSRGNVARSDARAAASAAPSASGLRASGVAGLAVPADAVRRAMPPGARPTGSFVAAAADHPAGVRIQTPGVLRGVLLPGDVLTEVEGLSLSSWDVLVRAVSTAYGRGAQAVHGKLWRAGELVSLTVYLPREELSGRAR